MLEQLELIPLSPAEVAVRSKELAALVHSLHRLEAAAKDSAKAHKEAIAQVRSDLARLADSVAHEAEYRDPYGRAARELDDGGC